MSSLSYSASTALVVTNLHSLASSTTAGWSSAFVASPSSTADVLISVRLSVANTAPASGQMFHVYAYGSVNGTTFNTTGVPAGVIAGTEGALTFPSSRVATMIPLLGVITHTAAMASDILTGTFSLSSAFGGIAPPYWGVAIVNDSGAALTASGSTVKYSLVTYA